MALREVHAPPPYPLLHNAATRMPYNWQSTSLMGVTKKMKKHNMSCHQRQVPYT